MEIHTNEHFYKLDSISSKYFPLDGTKYNTLCPLKGPMLVFFMDAYI